jgi:membrane-bound lytic murein transglycosylase B/chitodextrinase
VLATTAVVSSAALAATVSVLPHVLLRGGHSDVTTVSMDGTRMDDTLRRRDFYAGDGDSGVAAGVPVPASGGAAPSGSTQAVADTAPEPVVRTSHPRPGTISDLAASGIPEVALRAYRAAEASMAQVDPSCRIHWSLLAGIGRVESNHGRFGGAVLRTDGRPDPAIIGIALDGRPGVARISDSDGGRFDGDTTFDRAVGPMQFIPGTWAMVGADGDDDGVADPQDIDDAALGAAVYLCSGSDDLSTQAGREAAVFRYNHAKSYVALVLALADAYRAGLPVDKLPIGAPTASPPKVPSTPPTQAANPGPPGAVEFVDGPATGSPSGSPTAPPSSRPTTPGTTKPPTTPGTHTPGTPETPGDSGPTPTPDPTTKPPVDPPKDPPPTEDPKGPPADTTAPDKPSGLSVSAGIASVSVGWAKNSEDDVAGYEFRYGTTSPPEGAARKTTELTTTIKDLEVGKRVYVQVRALDKAGNSSPWSSSSAVPTSADDTASPSAPTELTAKPAATTLELSWTAATDTDPGKVIGYYVYVNGVRQTDEPVAETSFTVKGLDPVTEYTVKVRAVDSGFNQSEFTEAKTVKTTAPDPDPAPAPTD